MRNFLKPIAVIVSVVVFAASFSACDSNKENNTSTAMISSEVESEAEKRDSEDLKAEIIGQWGRLDEVMHYFNPDMTCVIGGMQGTYDIDENCSLVMTTMSGSVTTYEWARMRTQAKSENYWYLDGELLKVNGNEFVKIESKNTPDFSAE